MKKRKRQRFGFSVFLSAFVYLESKTENENGNRGFHLSGAVFRLTFLLISAFPKTKNAKREMFFSFPLFSVSVLIFRFPFCMFR